MIIDVVMPKMGESIVEGTILEWKKNVGDKIEKDQIILEISTDKVDSEIPSPVEGTILKILYEKGDVVEVGAAIAIVGDSNEVVYNANSQKEENDKQKLILSKCIKYHKHIITFNIKSSLHIAKLRELYNI